jgi:peptidoglycan/xylan/chitin deacetylase (PgdA/CDA1 family)
MSNMFERKRTIPVFAYHHVAPDREITPEVFEAQLLHLTRNNYKFLTGDELSQFLSGKKKFDRAVMLTFDDGYADNWIYAFPLIRKYRAKALIFLPTAYIQKSGAVRPTSAEGGAITNTIEREREAEGFLTWGEARKMSESGLIEFGSHTVSHKNFIKNDSYRDGIEFELSESKKAIEEALAKECYQLGWPWGDYKKEWLGPLKERGYRLAYLYSPGPNAQGADPFLVHRSAAHRSKLFPKRLRLYENYYFMSLYEKVHGFDRRIMKIFK